MADPNYQTKVYHEQGGDVLVLASGGVFKIEDGSSFFINAASGEVTYAQLKQKLYAENQVVTHAQASVSVANVLQYSQLLTDKKFVRLSMTSNLTAGALWFASAPAVGQELIITIAPGSVASGNVTISCSTGVTLKALAGFSNSRMILYNSTNSLGKAHLVCFEAGEWSVIATSSATAVTFT